MIAFFPFVPWAVLEVERPYNTSKNKSAFCREAVYL